MEYMVNTTVDKKYILDIILGAHAILTVNEGALLFSLAKNASQKGVIVEIGSYKGGSTVLLAKGSQKGKKDKVYAVDPHPILPSSLAIGNHSEIWPKNPFLVFEKNIKKYDVEDVVIPIRKTSEEAVINWRKPIKLLWIDGNHDYGNVKTDFLQWEKHLIEEGIVAFHDSCNSDFEAPVLGGNLREWDGPAKVVKKYILCSKRFKKIKIVDSITFAQKTRKAGILEFTKNEIDIYVQKNMLKSIAKIGSFLKKHYPKVYTFLRRRMDMMCGATP